MTDKYRTRDGDTLDQICRVRYGRESAVPELLEANPKLAEQPARLPAGVLIDLPALSANEVATPLINLWD
ncbi:tail protein X [Microbulbifer sp. PSTR4-B]|uniref:tail protein X n=1 Tax=unclassified Microbulbifer TaxID=2619833 RepID=UPI00403AD0AC